ncbi:ATP-binding protein [Flavobacterium rhizosphaerae]|uniref:ATP-binding protein n=1 Tax=Flavobacterium rhizosphaerae TaxID=3163298 RepID=A0ABW8YTC5_9FLAO
MTAIRKHTINNSINPDDLWKGIGGHFDSLHQILHEIVDNSISNFKFNPNLPHHTILIKINTDHYSRGYVDIFIEDTGSGITNIDSAFTLGDRNNAESPLNEHGFGLKHALASANPKNDDWAVYTRNKQSLENNEVVIVKSPYKINGYEAQIFDFNINTFPSTLGNVQTGTIVHFTTTKAMYQSLGKYGIKDPHKIALYLKEDLGFIYAGIIKRGIAEIQILIDNHNKLTVNSVEPWWKNTISPGIGNQKIDLGLMGDSVPTGEVTISYQFGTINNREAVDENEKIVYYQTNMKSSSVEIRVNGRMIKNNLLSEVWENVDQHNRFNNFLVTIDLISDQIDSLPATKSSKNGFRQADIKLIGLYNWIKSHCNVPYENERDEIHLFEHLKTLKQKQLSEVIESPISIDINRRILKISKESIKVDLFVAYDSKIILYKGKKGISNAIDLYTLRLYWDACVVDKLIPTSAILIAVEHSDTVQDLVAMNNTLKDMNGNNYKFLLKKWSDEGVDYPKREI